MADDAPIGPKFPGELDDRYRPPDDPTPAEGWSARLRHAWPVYVAILVGVPIYAGVVYEVWQVFGPWAAGAIALSPLLLHGYVLTQLRHIGWGPPGRE